MEGGEREGSARARCDGARRERERMDARCERGWGILGVDLVGGSSETSQPLNCSGLTATTTEFLISRDFVRV